MALTEKLEMLISMDPSQAVSELRRFSGEAEKSLSAAESSVRRFRDAGTKLMSLGAGGVGVGGLLTQMASGDIEATNSLKASVTAVGQSYDQFKDKIESTASAQAKFGRTDEEATKALSTLTLAYGDTGKALNEMQLVADLAAKKNVSLADAATMVARAHGGSAKLFKEFGIVVDKNADGTKNYDGALTELSQKLSGQASASVDSWGGKLKVLRAEIENQVSQFGQKYGPAILAASSALTVLGGVTSGVAGVVGKLREAHAASAAASAAAAASEAALAASSVTTLSALNAEVAAQAGVASSATLASAATKVEQLSMLELGASGSTAAAALEADQLVLFQVAEGAAAASVATEAQAVALLLAGEAATGAGVATEGLALAEGSAAVASGSLVAALGPIALVAAAAGAAMVLFGNGSQEVSVDVEKFARRSDEQINEFLRTFGKVPAVAREVADKLATGGEAGVGALVRLRDAAKEAGQDFGVYDQAIAAAKSSQENMNSTVAAGSDALGGNSSALKAANEAAKSFAEGSKKLQDAQDAVATSLGSVASALDAAYGRTVDPAKLIADLAAKTQDLTVAIAKNGTTLDINTESGRKNQDAVLATGAAVAKLVELKFKETGSLQEAQAAGNDYVENLRGQLRQAGLTNSQVETLIATMKLTPKDIETTFGTNAPEVQKIVEGLRAKIQEVPPDKQTAFLALIDAGSFNEAQNLLNNLARDREVRYVISQIGFDPSQVNPSDFQPRASGGDFGPGMLLVGEQGPELMRIGPNATGTVWSNPDTKKMLGNTSSSWTVNQTIVAPDPQSAADAAARSVRRVSLLRR